MCVYTLREIVDRTFATTNKMFSLENAIFTHIYFQLLVMKRKFQDFELGKIDKTIALEFEVCFKLSQCIKCTPHSSKDNYALAFIICNTPTTTIVHHWDC